MSPRSHVGKVKNKADLEVFFGPGIMWFFFVLSYLITVFTNTPMIIIIIKFCRFGLRKAFKMAGLMWFDEVEFCIMRLPRIKCYHIVTQGSISLTLAV